MSVLTKDFGLLSRLPTDNLILFTLRHGESVGQIMPSTYKTIGDTKLPLTQLGCEQATASGELIDEIAMRANLGTLHVLTSTGKRSTTTAAKVFHALKDHHTVTYASDKRLDKQKFGLFDGLFTRAERQAHCPKDYAIYAEQLAREGLFHARPPGGESIADVQARIRDLLDDLKKSPAPTIIITHGTNALCVENVLLNHGEKWVLDGIDKRPNCSVHLLQGNDIAGFTAQVVSDDPLGWKKQQSVPKFHLPEGPALRNNFA